MQALVLASGSQYRADLLRRLQRPFSQFSPQIDESARPQEAPSELARRLARQKACAPSIRGYIDSLISGDSPVHSPQSANASQPNHSSQSAYPSQSADPSRSAHPSRSIPPSQLADPALRAQPHRPVQSLQPADLNEQTDTTKNSAKDTGAIIIASDQVAAVGEQLLGKPGTAERAKEQLASMRGKRVVFSTALYMLNTHSQAVFTALDETVAQLRMLSDAEIERYIDADQPLDCAGSFKVEALGISLFDSVESQDPTALIGLPMIAVCEGLRQLGLVVP